LGSYSVPGPIKGREGEKEKERVWNSREGKRGREGKYMNG